MIDIRNEIIWKDYNFLLDKLTKYEDMGFDIQLIVATIAAPGYVTLYNYISKPTVTDNSNGIVSELYYDGYKKNGFFYIIAIKKSDVYQWKEMSEVFNLLSSKFKKSSTHRGTGEVILQKK